MEAGRLPARRILFDAKLVSALAAAAGQALMLAAMALVTRAYSKDALSAYGLLFALFNVLQIGVTLRLEQGIVYTHDEARFRALHQTVLRIVVPGCAILGAASWAYFALNPTTDGIAGELALLVALATAGAAAARTQILALARAEQNYLVALANFLRPAFIALFQLLAILTTFRGGVSLAAAFALAQLGLFAAVSAAGRGRLPPLAAPLGRGAATQALRDNRAFVLYSLPQNIVFTLGEALFALSVTFLFPGSHGIALFWLASRAVFAPATVLSESVRPMVYRLIARSEHQLSPVLARYAAAFLAIGAVPLAILLAFGEPLFALVFGAEWGEANAYAVVLSLLVMFNMAGLPFIGALPVLNAQRGMLLAELAGLAARAALLFLVPWPDPVAALAGTTIAYIVVIGLFFGWVWRQARRRDRHG